MATRLLAVTLATALAVGFAASVSFAACPNNRMTDAHHDQDPLITNLPADSLGDGTLLLLKYDIPAAHLEATARCQGAVCGAGDVFMVDEFHVVGMAPGTPVALVAHLDAVGPFGGVALQDSLGHVVSASLDPMTQVEAHLALDVPAVSGQPFSLQFRVLVAAGGFNGDGFVGANFSFSGLPPGSAVVSCNGYDSGQAVPTKRSSWGALKSHYR